MIILVSYSLLLIQQEQILIIFKKINLINIKSKTNLSIKAFIIMKILILIKIKINKT